MDGYALVVRVMVDRAVLAHPLFTGISVTHLASLVEELACPWAAVAEGRRGRVRAGARYRLVFVDRLVVTLIHLRHERRAARRVQDVLPDGSYLALIQANKHAKAAGTVKAAPALVRVIEYRVDGQADVIRLVTSLRDHEEYPAAELATLYARRWEIEIVFDEIKTHQRGRPILRSQTPDGVRQEIYAHLIVHHATRDLLNEVAQIA